MVDRLRSLLTLKSVSVGARLLLINALLMVALAIVSLFPPTLSSMSTRPYSCSTTEQHHDGE